MLRLRDNVSIAESEDNVVLLDERAGEYFQLNPSGALALRTLLDGGTPDQAVRALTEQFDVDGERAGKDVMALVADLRAAGLVIS
ncbi:HPr-rel-A system PqqD family protein [Actinosynnema sp. ALI-1.44]|uniref:lasso peptide biosynthesis PqqD family chaperone n=1 Tax=Actinosynnema sp. ALI-1.44 TaxID=1933779 RepID=UPI00097BD03B|nr:lasso peptide biosynthesis PqqD family chaperone [Actinosynnema sp. ALI-1.44]ONI80974.1 HPr-rel-A system PqqD family protein [Actinosynnema sp. ALI-1.44]